MFRQPIYKRRWFKVGLVFMALIACLYIMREPLLQGVGNFLVRQDECEKVDAIAILGGNSYERGLEGFKLYQEEWSEMVVCTGGNIPTVFDAMDTVIYESELTRSMLIKKGIPQEDVIALKTATSTREEAVELVNWCRENNWKSLMVVSSTFHTRRVSKTFETAFEGSGINLVFRAAPSQNYDENRWWEAEPGLIMVFNEYAKTVYYLIR